MAHSRECCFLLMLSVFTTCLLPSLCDTDAQILLRFKSSLTNAVALKNWGDESISICSWTGLICNEQKVHGLRLENMELSGTINIDTLLELSSLRTFSVMNNKFEGPMPAFKKLVSLRGLFLSKNKFSGEINDDAFDGMTRLKRVFFAENEFSGHIPTSLAKLPRLLDVDLHGNSFRGNIPEFQQSDFRVFNLSNNQLEGRIPQGLSNRDPSSYAGNKNLCGQPLHVTCSIESNPLPNEEKGNKKRVILITAIVVVIVLVLVTILALLFIRSRRKQSGKKNPNMVVEQAQAVQVQAQSSPSTTVVSSEAKSTDVVASVSVPKKGEDGDFKFVKNEREGFDLEDLLRASAEVLGSGSFGSTYKAMVLNGSVVVVKRFKHMNNVGKQEFFEHMRRLGRLTHPNLLPLVAFYYGKEEKLLVYDFVENGSLASHLHGRRGFGLDWATRLKIIKGIARGLSYLYREFPDQKLPHGHLKSSNVILNNSFDPLLTEYGLVPVINKAHAQQFMASFKSPEVSNHDSPSDKTDVWCLGILILELLTGKFPANYLRHGKGASEEVATWVKSMAGESGDWSGEVIDREMISGGGGGGGEGEMVKLLRIGVGCCESDLESRLSWKEALQKIEELKEKDHVEADENVSGVSDWDLYSI